MVFGGLYVQDGIDPTYLAFKPRTTVPFDNSLQGIWMEGITGGIASLRTQKLRLDDFYGDTAGYIDIDPIHNPQFTLSDGLVSELNVLTLNNNEINFIDTGATATTSMTTTSLSQTIGSTGTTATWTNIINSANNQLSTATNTVFFSNNTLRIDCNNLSRRDFKFSITSDMRVLTLLNSRVNGMYRINISNSNNQSYTIRTSLNDTGSDTNRTAYSTNATIAPNDTWVMTVNVLNFVEKTYNCVSLTKFL
jgi:hypothetical protein